MWCLMPCRKTKRRQRQHFYFLSFWSWACVVVTFSPILRENRNSGEKGYGCMCSADWQSPWHLMCSNEDSNGEITYIKPCLVFFSFFVSLFFDLLKCFYWAIHVFLSALAVFSEVIVEIFPFYRSHTWSRSGSHGTGVEMFPFCRSHTRCWACPQGSLGSPHSPRTDSLEEAVLLSTRLRLQTDFTYLL